MSYSCERLVFQGFYDVVDDIIKFDRLIDHGLVINYSSTRDLDFFRHQKEEGFHGSLSSMQKLATWLLSKLNDIERKTVTPEELRQLWQTLVQICLWGNR